MGRVKLPVVVFGLSLLLVGAPAARTEDRPAAGWVADASKATIPDRPAAGQLHGRPFAVGSARAYPYAQTSGNAGDPPDKQERADGAAIWLKEGPGNEPSNHFVIFLAVRAGDTVDGKTFVVPPGGLFKQADKIPDKDGKGWFYPVAGVQAWSQQPGKEPRVDLLPKVTMKLTLGRRKDGRLPGKIYLCLDDPDKTFVAGSFEAIVDKDEPKK